MDHGLSWTIFVTFLVNLFMAPPKDKEKALIPPENSENAPPTPPKNFEKDLVPPKNTGCF